MHATDLVPLHFHDPLQADGKVRPVQVPVLFVAHFLETKLFRGTMHWPHNKTRSTQRAQTSADLEDPDFGLWTPGSEA